jgi:hypothetical protein
VLDRSQAKAGILVREDEDAELRQAMSKARGLEVTLTGHKHAEAMRDKELGFVGQWTRF